MSLSIKKKNLSYQKPKFNKKKIVLNYFASRRNEYDSFSGMNGEVIYLALWGCIVEGSSITLNNGNLKKVEEIKEGDIIASWDIKESKKASSEVKEIQTNSEVVTYIVINDTLKLTPNHRMWINNLEWKRADDISVGTTLINYLGKEVIVTKIESVHKIVTTYNIRTEGNLHNFFAEGLLVHE